MMKLFSRGRFELNFLDPRKARCVEFLAQGDAGRHKEINPACRVPVKPRTGFQCPQAKAAYVNVTEEVADATSASALTLRQHVTEENRGVQMGSNIGLVGRHYHVSQKPLDQIFRNMSLDIKQSTLSMRCMWIHTSQQINVMEHPSAEPQSSSADISSPSNGSGSKPKKKKLKGKRAVVRWLKFFRWRKKKEYNRMTAEEKILYKLRKAKKKEARLAEALGKIGPADASEVTHDPEILTPEEHFYLLKMGRKSKNYVPVGRRGVFQGVILNMHLHWKKHQTVKVVVKTFTRPEVRGIAAELARLTGGVVLDVQEEGGAIIMYRGKNYVQPPPEIMSPRVTLSRKKALDKSKYRDALRAVQKYIPRLEEDMEALRAPAKAGAELRASGGEGGQLGLGAGWPGDDDDDDDDAHLSAEDGTTEPETLSESEALSDIFDSDSEGETRGAEARRPLYLDTIERFFEDEDRESAEEDRPAEPPSAASEESPPCSSPGREADEIDRMFLQATTLLKRRPAGRKK